MEKKWNEVKKKRFAFYARPEIVEGLQKLIQERGISFSEYLDTVLEQHLNSLKIFKKARDLEDVNLRQLITIFNMAVEGFKNVQERGNKK